MIPFSTALLAEFMTYRAALLVYWANILLIGVVLYLTWGHASRAKLIKADAAPDVIAAICRRIIIAQSLYALGAALCVFNTYLSIAFIALIQINYAIAMPLTLRRSA